MLKALRGTKDILPADISAWQHIESCARDIFAIYNYKEIRTPVIEQSSLFTRSIGDYTDIVQKEMYVFSDRGGRNIALRPEATASVVRAYIENYNGQLPKIKKFFYLGPMFRAERPQKGRQRQFHQLGAELIGSDEPIRDAEIIYMAVDFLENLHMRKDEFYVKLNSLGCEKDKALIIQKYKKIISPILGKLCEKCKMRYDKNALRILDCKNPECGKILKNIKVENVLCSDCEAHFKSVEKYLNDWGVKPIIDPKIVRGLDYYTKTVFEITHKKLGAQDAICAGGRYNNLIKDIGGKDTPAIGFAFGIERLILAGSFCDKEKPLDVFIATTGKMLNEKALMLLKELREGRVRKSDNSLISYDVYLEEESLKGQLKQAQREGSKFVIIFGEQEFQENKVLIKDMKTGCQEKIDCDFRVILAEIEKKIREIDNP